MERHRRRWVCWGLALISSLLVLPAWAQSDSTQLRTHIMNNNFITSRSFTKISGFFGPRFQEDMARWKPSMKILDAGAGNANFFIDMIGRARSTTTSEGAPSSTLPRLVAVAAQKPGGDRRLERELARPGTSLSYAEGFLGDRRRGLAFEKQLGFGTFDRIIDSFGASLYSEDLSGIFKSYGKLLKPGGLVYTHVMIQDAPTAVSETPQGDRVNLPWGRPRTSIQDGSGRPVPIRAWLEKISGFELVGFEPSENGYHHKVTLRRTTAPLAVPELKLDAMHVASPPYRAYTLSEP